VPPSFSSGSALPPSGFLSQTDDQGEFCPLSEIEKRHILSALDRSHGNRTHAAKMLGISIRTLRNKLNEYNYRALTSGPDAGSGNAG